MDTTVFLSVSDALPAEAELLASMGASTVTSKRITGDLVDAGVVVTLTAATIKLLRDFLVAYIGRDKSIVLKWNGYEVTAHSVADAERLMKAVEESVQAESDDSDGT